MKKKIVGILVATLLITVTFGIIIQPVGANPLPIEKVKEIPVPWQFWVGYGSEGVLDTIVLYEEVPNQFFYGFVYVLLHFPRTKRPGPGSGLAFSLARYT